VIHPLLLLKKRVILKLMKKLMLLHGLKTQVTKILLTKQMMSLKTLPFPQVLRENYFGSH